MPSIGGLLPKSWVMNGMTDLETPSGKGAGDENFPVGSWLLAAAHRPHVMAFYHFVRAADDIADNPKLSGEEKLERLEVFEKALLGDRTLLAALPKAATLRRSLEATGLSSRHALDVLKAFKQDAVKTRYADWDELLDYCAHSASPVGRYLLDLHREDPALYDLSDPLCDALQILNHLQDCADDLAELDRLYLPGDFLKKAGIDQSALTAPSSSPALRSVIDATLDGTDTLLQKAAALPEALQSRRLGAESAVILEMAGKLSSLLRRQDPIARRVELAKPAFIFAALKGLGRLRWLRRRRHDAMRMPEETIQ